MTSRGPESPPWSSEIPELEDTGFDNFLHDSYFLDQQLQSESTTGEWSMSRDEETPQQVRLLFCCPYAIIITKSYAVHKLL
jgi:hypothetical protein